MISKGEKLLFVTVILTAALTIGVVGVVTKPVVQKQTVYVREVVTPTATPSAALSPVLRSLRSSGAAATNPAVTKQLVK